MVDHIDHDGLNNRRENLRETNPQLNNANRRKQEGVTSLYKGVYLHRSGNRRKPWEAQIKISGHSRYLGYFSSQEEAARTYDKVALETWGEHAYTNFPRSDYGYDY